MFPDESNLNTKTSQDCDDFGLTYCDIKFYKRIAVFVLAGILILISLISFVILILVIRKRWANWEFFLLFILLINLILGIDGFVHGALRYLHGKWPSSVLEANISGFVFMLHSTTYSPFLIALMAEKYIAFLHRLWHIMNFKALKSVAILVFIFIVGIIASLIPVILGSEFDYWIYPGVLTVFPSQSYGYLLTPFIIIAAFLLYLFIWLLVIALFYIRMALKIRKLIKEKASNRREEKRVEREFHYYLVQIMGAKVALVMAVKYFISWLIVAIFFEVYALEVIADFDLGTIFTEVAQWSPYLIHLNSILDSVVIYIFHFRLRAKFNKCLKFLTGIANCLNSVKTCCKDENGSVKRTQRLVTLEQWKELRN